jgi:tetratricopeptide (TPR) repeat protein
VSGSLADEFLDELERLTSMEEFTTVYALAADVLALARDPRSEALARVYLGLAQVGVVQTDLAIRNIRRARATFESLGDERMVVECLDWEATALHLNERADALQLEEEALRRCRALRPVPEAVEARIQGHLGAIHTGRHDWAKAIRSYEAALAARERVRDLGRLARMYNDLSIAFLETGDHERSLTYAQKALAIHSMVRDETSIARVENNRGLVLMRHGMLHEAEECLKRSLELCEKLHLERGRSHVLLSLGELCFRLGDFHRAEALLLEAAQLAERLDEPMTLAAAYQWLGWLHAQRGDADGTDAAFQRALALLADGAVGERLAECHVQYGRALEARGDLTGALWHWKQAMGIVHARDQGPLGAAGAREG